MAKGHISKVTTLDIQKSKIKVMLSKILPVATSQKFPYQTYKYKKYVPLLPFVQIFEVTTLCIQKGKIKVILL